MQERGVSYNGP